MHYLGYAGQNDEAQSGTVESVFIWKYTEEIYCKIEGLKLKEINGSVSNSSELPALAAF